MKTMLSALACVIAFSMPTMASAGTITIQGSDTLLEMVTAEAAAYSTLKKGTSVQVTGGGSGTGIAAILNGTVDIADASRPMKKKERKRVVADGGTVFELAIALDGISLYINPTNKVSNLTMAQLKDIYTGKVNNWKEVGGADAQIIRYSRENSSGTYAFLKEHVLKKENYAPDCQALPGTASVVNAVTKDKNGIGYGGLLC